MKRNWPLWTGFLLAIAAFFSYFLIFARYPITRDVPWVNLILFAVAMALLVAGVRRAFAAPRSIARRIVSTLIALLGTAVTVVFLLGVFVMSRDMPASPNAPAVGQKAPDFTLVDSEGKMVSLAQLVSSSPHGVLLIFYRGYW